jgi:altronate dehydratase small subunit
MSAGAFQIAAADNVATLLADAGPGPLEGRRGSDGQAFPLVLAGRIARGHKVAVTAIAAQAPVIKFGARIGHATRAIAAGEWVHLHNCASDFDERSAHLDQGSGAAIDTGHAYV